MRAVQGGLAAHARDDQRDARLPLRGLQRRSPLRRGLKQPAPQVRVRNAGTNAAGEESEDIFDIRDTNRMFSLDLYEMRERSLQKLLFL